MTTPPKLPGFMTLDEAIDRTAKALGISRRKAARMIESQVRSGGIKTKAVSKTTGAEQDISPDAAADRIAERAKTTGQH